MKKTFLTILIALSLLTLAVGAAFAATSKNEKELRFQGTFNEIENDEVNMPILYLHGNGSGQATELGQYTSHMEGIVHNDANGVGIAVEGVHFTAANGDILFATGTGVGVPSKTPGVNTIVETYTITGGTGRYLNASGHFTVERMVNLTTFVSSGTIKGEIKLH